MNNLITEIITTPISHEEIYSFLSDHKFGAQVTFFGVVRNNYEGKSTTGMYYDVFAPLAKKTLQLICEEAQLKWGPAMRIIAVHRTGELAVGESSIAIGVGAPHRDEAFQACRYVIEEIKTRLPIWKEERYAGGTRAWLEGKQLSAATNGS